ncbi:MAG: hypothetical protein WC496_02835 [Phycisphaerae bacterium]
MTNKKLFEVKKLFFDRAKVIRAVSKAARKTLNHIGGLIRLTARRSIRDAKNHNAVSRPGKPPLSHTGLLKRFIMYAYEPSKETVVVGPVLLGGRQGKDAPHTLEFGGSAKANSRRLGGRRNVFIKPRPYMYPALEKNQQTICKILKNSM